MTAAAGFAQVRVSTGPVNSVALPDGAAIYGGARSRTVLVTHTRRDVLWAAGNARLVVPEAEAKTVMEAETFWRLFRQTRFHDYAQKSTKLPERNYTVARTVRGGDRLRFGGVEVTVVDTPGFTAGSVSYVFENEGKRYAATGDLLYQGGRLMDIYSLQDSIASIHLRGYHGFAARARQVIDSLQKIKDLRPDILIPARGPLIDHPAEEIERLTGRLQALVDSHYSTDSLRWGAGDANWLARAEASMGRTPSAPVSFAAESKQPGWLIRIGTSRLIVSASGAAFLIDAGNPLILEKLEELRQQGLFRNLEGIWITHYHDDHTDLASKVSARYGATIYFTERMGDILARPGRYRMPCLTTAPIEGLPRGDGERWQWREFQFTSYYFPGQTLYHGGLSVESESGEKVFFAGDSFSPSGIDDYCPQNRNWVHASEGYNYCLDLLEKLGPDYWLINQHITPMFRFDSVQMARIRAELAKREQLLAELTPLPDANFAVDEGWARIYPYSVKARPGQTESIELRIQNHDSQPREFRVRWNVPAGWKLVRGQDRITLAPKTAGAVTATVRAVDPPEVSVLTADVAFAGFDLRRWTEALLERHD